MEETQSAGAKRHRSRCSVLFFLNYHYHHYYYYAGEQTVRDGAKGKNKRIQNRGRDSAVAKTCVSFHSMKFIGFDRSSPASLTLLCWTLWVSLPKAVGLRLCPLHRLTTRHARTGEGLGPGPYSLWDVRTCAERSAVFDGPATATRLGQTRTEDL